MSPEIELIVGIVCAFAGGELFVRGVLGISIWLRIPKAVTAATLAAFATSSPEISVAITAASAGNPQLALGDALGSNIVNVALILGLVLCIGPLTIDWKSTRRDFLTAISVPVLIVVFLADGQFTRTEGLICLLAFVCWLTIVFRAALRQRVDIESSTTRRQGIYAVIQGIIGLAILVVAGKCIVSGGTGIGKMLGMDAFLIGATMVAFGTSAPELATAVIAKLRGHDEVGVGTILGSNIFNCLFIIGLTVSIRPFEEPLAHVLASLLFGIFAVLCLAPFSGNTLSRSRGVFLLFVYAVSIITGWLIQKTSNPHP